jgi:predicted metal-dependent phosphoesterase TrpH
MTGEEHPQAHPTGQFLKVDFHIHTPESTCYGEPQVTPDQIVAAALAAGLDAISVTDHNTANGIDAVRRHGQASGLVVFPGVEVSTTSGHVLALFDPGAKVSELDEFLDDIGVRATARGDGTVPAGDPIEAILRKTVDRRGIAIPAHIERWPTGFLQTKQSRRAKQLIHNSENLAALEITQPQNRESWNAGKMRGFPERRACIQGSDAHALDEIGRRPIYLKLVSADLDGLRQALIDFVNSIRFPDEMRDRS